MGDETHMLYCIIDSARNSEKSTFQKRDLSFYLGEEHPVNDCAYNSISDMKFVRLRYKTAFVNDAIALLTNYERVKLALSWNGNKPNNTTRINWMT